MCPDPQTPLQPAAPPAAMPADELQHKLRVASQDLQRLQRLLSDATETLMGHFYGVSQQISKLSRLASQHPALPADDLHQALGHLSGAVTTLQFHDMASQLIHHTDQLLRHCADQLACGGTAGDAAVTAAQDGAPLRPNPVTQDEMDAGSIELF